MAKKWAVLDNYIGDIFFFETLEEALDDFDEAVSMVEDSGESGYDVFLFEVKRKVEVIQDGD